MLNVSQLRDFDVMCWMATLLEIIRKMWFLNLIDAGRGTKSFFLQFTVKKYFWHIGVNNAKRRKKHNEQCTAKYVSEFVFFVL